MDAAIHEAFLRDDTEVKKWFHDRFGDREPTLEELVEAIESYIGYYNAERIQRKLHLMTPMEYHEHYYAAA